MSGEALVDIGNSREFMFKIDIKRAVYKGINQAVQPLGLSSQGGQLFLVNSCLRELVLPENITLVWKLSTL